MIDKIKLDLPNFPDEVIESWILPFAIDRGWPPCGANGLFNENWKNLFGGFKDLYEMRSLSWEKSSFEINPRMIARVCRNSIMQIIESAVGGARDLDVDEYL